MVNSSKTDLDIVSALTQKRILPLLPIETGCMLAVAEAIEDAFETVCRKNSTKSLNWTEDRVTSLLQIELNRLIKKNIVYGNYVSYVARGASIVNYNGTGLNKSPDLSFVLSNEIYRNFPLVAESKIIDIPRGKTVELYDKNGINRFESGDYAWYSHEAFMIAYVLDGSSILANLHPYLKSKESNSISSLPMKINSYSGEMATSDHNRTFCYITPPYNSPGKIKLWHLWLTQSEE